MDKIKIEKGCYGYLWMSNQPEPTVIYNEPVLLSLDNDTNPFIVEGHLYVKDKVSYSIKYVDGSYTLKQYDLTSLPKEWVKEEKVKTFVANRLKKNDLILKEIHSEQYWEPKEDELCNGMNVLSPGAFIFVGFNNKEE